ncbi:MAG: hypothetical protein HYR51_17565 [Candidatus Rokubacteria bacterium]|nr:hypothetical protein [Candidatus Rokubacteria bacterium]
MLLPLAAAVLVACGSAAPPGRAAAADGISREEDRRLPPLSPPGLRAALAGGRVVIAWQPVGLEILRAYRVVRLEAGGPVHVSDVPADPALELSRARGYSVTDPASLPSGAHTYAVTAIDRDGNQSAPARVTVEVPPPAR